LLFKWFLDLPIDARAFDPTTFTKNRERLLSQEIADRFLAAVVAQARLRRYLSSQHFSVDGTLLEAWASHKSFKPKDRPGGSGSGRNPDVDFPGQQRSNETHQSSTDPEARLARKSDGSPAKLAYAGHLLMEHRNALIVDMELTEATGYAERDAAIDMLARLPTRARRRTLAADKGYDAASFVTEVRDLGFTPHVAPNTSRRRSAIDGRTTRHRGHMVSQRIRKRIEKPFGWMKTVAGGRKLRYIGKQRNRAWFIMTGAVYNIIRIAALDTPTP
jgi:IS5 family transposase